VHLQQHIGDVAQIAAYEDGDSQSHPSRRSVASRRGNRMLLLDQPVFAEHGIHIGIAGR
jgi:hypothetical protein